jgi:ribosome maturation factor RimP
MQQPTNLHDLIADAVASTGLFLWGIQQVSGDLKVYVESDAGLSIDMCQAASRQIDSVLYAAGLSDQYSRLEVSSPGLNRILFKPEHYQKYIGQVIKVKLLLPVDGVTNFRGTLSKVTQSTIELDTDHDMVMLNFDNIARTQLIHTF